MGKTIEISDTNFQDLVQSKVPVMVDFWAPWCGPCKMLGPIVEELASDFDGRAVIGKLDVDNNPSVSAEFNVRSIPTILFFKNGQVVDKQVGAVPKAVLEKKLEALM